MRTLAIHMLPGESPYQAVYRVMREVEKAFNVEISLELSQVPGGAIHVTADLFADVVKVDQITEETWMLIRASIQAVADRALRGDGT